MMLAYKTLNLKELLNYSRSFTVCCKQLYAWNVEQSKIVILKFHASDHSRSILKKKYTSARGILMNQYIRHKTWFASKPVQCAYQRYCGLLQI